LKGRSRAELSVRARQALAARAERCQLSAQTRVPSDATLYKLLDRSCFTSLSPPSAPAFAAELRAHFHTRRTPHFFAAFEARAETVAELRRCWPRSAAQLIARAERIAAGRFDLLGLSDLDFGNPPDWHLEPVASVRAPRVHWSRIAYLDVRVAGDKKITWELNRQQYFVTLGQAYWLTGDERYAQTFAAHLASWLDANPPKVGINWASSLEVALRAIAWLWAFEFFKDASSLTADLFARALKFLYLHARHLETYLSTYFSPNTHLTGEALGLYYLGTLLPEFQLAARWRETGRAILLAQLPQHVRADGTYFEQASYYARYTADFYTHFLLLAQANEQTVAPLVAEKLTALLDHLMHLTRPDGTTPLYGDDDGGRLVPLSRARAAADFRATLATGACLFARGDYKFVAGADAAEEALWLMGAGRLRAFDELAAHAPADTSRAFTVGGYYVMRSAWTRDADYMLLDAGPHGALNCGHAHADALAFDMCARGRNVLVDPGTYTYTGDAALRDHFRSTPAHNTLTIDGASSSTPAGPFSWQTSAHAHAHTWHTHARFDYFAGEHDGYAHLGIEHYERAVLFLKGDYFIVRDRVRATGAHRYDLNFHFAPGLAPVVAAREDAARVRVATDDEELLTLYSFGAQGGEWHTEEGWVSRCYGARAAATVCRFTAQGAGAQEFLTFMLPHGAQEARAISALAGGRVYELQHDESLDVLLTSSGGMITHGALGSDFAWTWARFQRDGALKELLLLDGRRCLLDGREIVKRAAPVPFVYVRRVGAELQIETDKERKQIDVDNSYALVNR
jgi:uncharacterized heparinase superfamily protein